MPQFGTIFDEYGYTEDDAKYGVRHPICIEGQWWLGGEPTSFDRIVMLCDIPSEEAIFLKLKYGG